MNPGGRTQQAFSVFFPSLSRDILGKAGAVSRWDEKVGLGWQTGGVAAEALPRYSPGRRGI